MAIILIELNFTRKNFFLNINDISVKINRNLENENSLFLDTLYTTIVSFILTGMLDDIRNKKISVGTFDSPTYLETVTDNVMFSFYDSFGYSLTTEEAYKFVSSVESGILEDIVRYIPDIDRESIEILNFTFLQTNSVAIEYKELVA